MRGTSKIILGLSICGLVLLLVAYGFYSRGLQAQDESRSQPTIAQPDTKPARSETEGRRQDTANNTERTPPQRKLNQPSADFYQPIVENNLFRPLGWKKPDDEAEFTLVGTLIESDNQRAKAFLIERRSNRYYPVTVGEKVGDAIVKSIKPNEVSLSEEGKTVTLRANSNRFLDTSGISDKGRASVGKSSERASAEKKASREGESGNRGNRGWDADRMRMMAERFRNASPEERRRMREEFRRRGRERRARGERGGGERARREGRGRGGNRDGDRDGDRRRD